MPQVSTPFAYTECNIFCIIVLAVLLVNMLNKGNKNLIFDQKLFAVIITLTIAILVADSLTWLLDGKTFAGAKFCIYTVNFIYYIIQPIICFMWLLYVDHKCFGNKRKLVQKIPLYILPALAFIVLSILSLFNYNLFFYIDGLNLYHRGPIMYVGVILAFSYFVVTSIYAIIHMVKAPTRIARDKFLTLLLYPVPVIIGSILQVVIPGLSVIWVSATISTLIIFLNLQSAQINNDYLTGVFNRRYFEQVLSNMMNGRDKNKLYAIIFDIDEFKQINDKQGHLMGDDALISSADIISKACIRFKSIVARFGGDEFIVVGQFTQEKDIEDLIAIINYDLSLFNERENRPYKLSFSYGVSLLAKDNVTTGDQFIKLADVRMYECKDRQRKQRYGETYLPQNRL